MTAATTFPDLFADMTPVVRGAAARLGWQARGVGMEADDLFQAGMMAVVVAAGKRRPRFSVEQTRRWLYRRAVGAMLDAMRSDGWYRKGHRRALAAGAVANFVSLSAVAARFADGRRPHAEVIDAIADPKAADPAEAADSQAGRVRAVLRELGVATSAAEAHIVWAYYGRGKTLKEAGAEIGLSESRSSQLRTRVIDRAREAAGVNTGN